MLAVSFAWETGLFSAPFQLDNMYLFAAFWGIFLLSALIQFLLLRRRPRSRILLILSAIGLVAMEFAFQASDGWDTIGWGVLWFAFLTMLAGAGLVKLIFYLRSR